MPSPMTDEYRCDCGRTFDSLADLASHEAECLAARETPHQDEPLEQPVPSQDEEEEL
jgi:hypothetical protein